MKDVAKPVCKLFNTLYFRPCLAIKQYFCETLRSRNPVSPFHEFDVTIGATFWHAAAKDGAYILCFLDILGSFSSGVVWS